MDMCYEQTILVVVNLGTPGCIIMAQWTCPGTSLQQVVFYWLLLPVGPQANALDFLFKLTVDSETFFSPLNHFSVWH